VEDDNLTWLWGGNNRGATARFTVDPSKDPKELDAVQTSGSGINQKLRGIYRMTKKGQMEICWSGSGDDPKRPRKFTGRITPGAGASWVIYRSEDYKDPPEIAREMKKLQGRWVEPGHPGDPVLIEDDVITYHWGGNQVGTVHRFAVDPSKDPKEIDLVCVQGAPGQVRFGIYRLKGDTLEVSMSGGGLDPKRPTKFADAKTPGGGAFYNKYQLQEK
jgi:uncharacterized protein (TIGR03067 family)